MITALRSRRLAGCFKALTAANILLLISTALISQTASAATIFECVQGDQHLYAQEKCPVGTRAIRQVEAIGQSPSSTSGSGSKARPKRSAQDISDRAELKRMNGIRRHYAAVERAKKKKEDRCAALARRVRWSEESRNVSYTIRASERARLRYRHLSEQYQAECRS